MNIKKNEKTLSELASIVNARVKGDANCKISSIATLQNAKAGQLSFLHNVKYAQYLATTKASAVLLTAEAAASFAGNALIVADPYYAYAQIANLFINMEAPPAGIHASAVVGDNCQIHPSVAIAAKVVIGDNVKIGENSRIDAGCVIGNDCQIGASSHLYPNVTLYCLVKMGDRVIIHSGVVIGADGFGLVKRGDKWEKIPQIGGVTIGNDVEVGSNTSIDRGAIDDTVIADGVKLDNLIQIAHNVRIGENTVIAGCAGIAGSTEIGKNCMIGGAAGISGHIKIADNVVIAAMGQVTKSIDQPGIYTSVLGIAESTKWRKNVIYFRHLDEMAKRLKKLEKLANCSK